MKARYLLLCWLAAMGSARALDYGLQPQAIAPDTYLFQGRNEDFSPANGGNIVNTGFIVTPAGIVVIDTGPSRRYGLAMVAAIRRLSPLPILRVFNTHHHPDHFLGNQAFAAPTLAALDITRQAMTREGPAFLDNMYRLTGDWMKDTELALPGAVSPGLQALGGRDLEVISLPGHTDADLVLFDHRSGVIFTGDLVFHGRAPTTPHAHLDQWLAALDQLEALTRHPDFRLLVPGHGAPSNDASPIRQTRGYLQWLHKTLVAAARNGQDMTEVMATPIPAPWASLAVVQAEFRRSVGHLYPALEQAYLEGKLAP